MQRYLASAIMSDALAAGKIAFISGPRQVGKTTMAQNLLNKLKQDKNYFTWDDQEFKVLWMKYPKKVIDLTASHATSGPVIVLDEIHKDRLWKNRLKGLYDLFKKERRFIVTGSARLDFFRKTGESLQGRYIPYRLHPFSLAESESISLPPNSIEEWLESKNKIRFTLEDLLTLSGFPEPLFAQKRELYERWHRLYIERVLKIEISDLAHVRDLNLLETLALFLERQAGSVLSLKSLEEDLSVSFTAIRSWIEILETLYFCFRVRPYSKNIKYSLKKEPKLYLYDWANLESEGARLENLVASHLLKACHAWTDTAAGHFELFYIRDKFKREVDFFVTKNKTPYLLIEVKSGQSTPTEALRYYQNYLKPKFCFQLVKGEKQERLRGFQHTDIQIMTVSRFLSRLL